MLFMDCSRVVGPQRLLYGSDYCWTPPDMVGRLARKMDDGAAEIWSENVVRQVYAGNARSLFGLEEVGK